MNTSEKIDLIGKALINFHKEVGKIAKQSTNPFFKSKYATLADILDVIQDPLTNNGLAIVQFPEGTNTLTTRIIHESGQFLESTYFMKPTKEDPQSFGSVITYQRRYALGAVLSLNIDEDDDGNKASVPSKIKESAKLELTPKDVDKWNKAVEYCATNGSEGILKKYTLCDDNYTLLIDHAQQLHLKANESKL